MAWLKYIAFLGLGACSGAPFEAVPGIAPNQAGTAPVAVGGIEGVSPIPQSGNGGTGSRSGASSTSNGGNGGNQGGNSSAGSPPMAGAAGDNGGTGGNGSGGGVGSFSCLAEYQNLDCARICTQSGTDCGLVIGCYIKTNQINRGPANPLDPCSNFTQDGIAIAQRAWLACCP